MGLRVLVGKRQAVVSTNDVKGNGADALAERAVAMARVAPEDQFAGLADASLLTREFPDLDLVDAELPNVVELEKRARAAEAAALGVKGVSKSGGASASAGIGGMVLVTSHGFRGAYVGSRHSMSMVAIAGDGTAMERDYDYSSTLHASRSRSAGEDRQARRRARGEAAQPAQGRDAAGAGRVRSARFKHAGRVARVRDQRRIDRTQDELPEGPDGREAVPLRHSHRGRSAAHARAALAAVRLGRRRGQAARCRRRRRAQIVVPRFGHRARART